MIGETIVGRLDLMAQDDGALPQRFYLLLSFSNQQGRCRKHRPCFAFQKNIAFPCDATGVELPTANQAED